MAYPCYISVTLGGCIFGTEPVRIQLRAKEKDNCVHVIPGDNFIFLIFFYLVYLQLYNQVFAFFFNEWKMETAQPYSL